MIADLVGLQERIATALWRNEVATGPHSAVKARANGQLRDESDSTRAKWLSMASAVIVELTHPIEKGS